MNSPKVSVIVPIYKVEKYLVQCINSIANQTLKDIEIILVDEGDMDACRYIIDHYEQTDNRVKTIHEKNGGYSASVNKGFDIATGEYISIIESDDFIEPTMFEKMYDYAKKLDADVVKTPYYEYWDKTAEEDEFIRPCFWYKKTQDIPEDKLFSIKEYPILMGIHPSIWSAIYKKEYLDKFNIRFLEDKGAYVDRHFQALTLLNTNKIAWLNEPFYKYRLSNENASAASFNVDTMIKRWSEFHKLIEEKYRDEYFYFAQYNLSEEYLNIFAELQKGNAKIKSSSYELLVKNLSYITFDNIKNVKNISEISKLFLYSVKLFPGLLKRYVKKSKRKEIVKVLGISLFDVVKIKRNTYKISLFSIIPLLKLKKKSNSANIYLFGLIPIVKIKGV